MTNKHKITPVDIFIIIEVSVAFVYIGISILLSDWFESNFAIIMRISVLYVIVLLLFVDNIAEISSTMEDLDHEGDVIDNDNVVFPSKNSTIEEHEDDGHHNHDHHDHDDHSNITTDHQEEHDHHDHDHHDHEEDSSGAGAATYSMLFFATTAITSVCGFWI